MILYSESYYILEVKKFDFAISAKNYYNFIYKIISDKNKLKIINNLFIIL